MRGDPMRKIFGVKYGGSLEILSSGRKVTVLHRYRRSFCQINSSRFFFFFFFRLCFFRVFSIAQDPRDSRA